MGRFTLGCCTIPPKTGVIFSPGEWGWGCDGVTATGTAPRRPPDLAHSRQGVGGGLAGLPDLARSRSGVSGRHRTMSGWMEHRQQGARMSTGSSPSPKGSPDGRGRVGGSEGTS
eukprot:gene14827-biopygen21673